MLDTSLTHHVNITQNLRDGKMRNSADLYSYSGSIISPLAEFLSSSLKDLSFLFFSSTWSEKEERSIVQKEL